MVQDIGGKYPEWLEANKDKLSAGKLLSWAASAFRHARAGFSMCSASVTQGGGSGRVGLHLPLQVVPVLDSTQQVDGNFPCAEDMERYQQQLVYIRRICELYETSPNEYAQLVDLLQQVRCAALRCCW